MPKFRKKPVVIEAVQFLGKDTDWRAIEALMGPPNPDVCLWKSCTYEGGYILTLEGRMEFNSGDWIIKGIMGELYPCKPDIFAATYEECNG